MFLIYIVKVALRFGFCRVYYIKLKCITKWKSEFTSSRHHKFQSGNVISDCQNTLEMLCDPGRAASRTPCAAPCKDVGLASVSVSGLGSVRDQAPNRHFTHRKASSRLSRTTANRAALKSRTSSSSPGRMNVRELRWSSSPADVDVVRGLGVRLIAMPENTRPAKTTR